MVAVVASRPRGGCAPDVGEAPEPVLVQAAVPELAVEALHEGVLGGLAGLDEVQDRAGPFAPKAHRLAGQFGAVVADDGLGRRRGLAQLVQEERQPAPVIEAATSWPTHILAKKSSTTFRMRNRRPLASWSDMKSTGQRSFGRVGAASGTRGRHSLLRRLVRTCRPSRE